LTVSTDLDAKQPNAIIAVADGMGWSEIGYRGGGIES
jgi:alkaline phosphatase|tara:strand:+ start:283 stop:393 length:111 start_codon:yes stop_codon:yes gene_type:complete